MKYKETLGGLLILIGFFLSACQTNQTDELLSLDDISKASEVYTESDSMSTRAPTPIFYYDSISSFSQRISDSLHINPVSIKPLIVDVFPDRFGAVFTEKWYSKTEVDSLVFMRWTFDSKLKTENALYNWLDCYGPKCRAIPFGSETYFSKRGTMILWIQNELFFIESSRKIVESDWMIFIQDSRKRIDWKFFIFQQPNKKIVWKTVDEKGEWVNYNEIVE